ncbi:hypothetical protein MRB53_038779 [Persea americana]|nr:hypothetical protein MRB53_038779 [Persea americana]
MPRGHCNIAWYPPMPRGKCNVGPVALHASGALQCCPIACLEAIAMLTGTPPAYLEAQCCSVPPPALSCKLSNHDSCRKALSAHLSPLICLKKSMQAVKTTSKMPPPGPSRSTFGKKPLYRAPKPSSLATVPSYTR